jgi:hypothetical protein
MTFLSIYHTITNIRTAFTWKNCPLQHQHRPLTIITTILQGRGANVVCFGGSEVVFVEPNDLFDSVLLTSRFPPVAMLKASRKSSGSRLIIADRSANVQKFCGKSH